MDSGTSHTPLITVVTVCLNAEAHLARALDSVLAQTYADFEYVVVDGASTDGTTAVLAAYEPRFAGRMRWLSEPDEGLYHAMNKGVALARGDFIGILNADDTYESDALARVAAAVSAHPSAGVIYGDDRTVSADGSTRLRPTPPVITAAALRRDHIVHHHAAFVATSVYRRIGAYDTSHPIAADYDFFLRCAEEGTPFVRIDGVVTNFSLQGVSHDDIRATDRDATRVRIEHGVAPAAAWARFYKRALAYQVYTRLERFAAFRSAYARYRARQSR